MDYRTLTSLMLRIAGVLTLVQLATGAPRMVTNLLYFGGKTIAPLDVFVFTVLAFMLPLAIGLVLIYFPSAIANRIIRADGAGETKAPEARAVAESLLPVAIACLGVYFVSAALFDGVYWFSKLKLFWAYMEQLPSYQGPALTADDFGGIVSTACQFVIGLGLLFGSKGISKLAVRLRS